MVTHGDKPRRPGAARKIAPALCLSALLSACGPARLSPVQGYVMRCRVLREEALALAVVAGGDLSPAEKDQRLAAVREAYQRKYEVVCKRYSMQE